MIYGLVVVCATSLDLCALIGTERAYPSFAKCRRDLPIAEEAAVDLFSKSVEDVEYEIVQSWCGDPDDPAPINS